MMRYVCGFFFSLDRSRVLLIQKNRPAWQAGKFNGVGGKIEIAEKPADAMRREFLEEAGLDVKTWEEVVILIGADNGGSGSAWTGHFFRAFGDIDSAVARTDEPLSIFPVRALPPKHIDNLKWLVPLLLDDDLARGNYSISAVPGAKGK